ncbi:enoyl-CoA hydratase-related protein [Sphaerobacter sp.]|uniref:enoyl-CoA hydratase-related protein n=1 Tax=Sphaerobacter sp. TaxID=2099654 RepID=UPI001E00D5EA|nr:enoyl-CoA hydratase-related protein [Sphaerobacter sp.]MBX5446364.1 enoyl-CoA hydratase/isomerase family protein [Sphaerobacter sp.]
MDPLRTEQRGPALWLTLNRPEKRNPLGRDLLRALHGAIMAATDRDDVRCIVLAGAGPVFCAGADLTEFVQAEDPAVLAADGELLARLLQSIVDSPKPVIARVQGAALAGGAGLVAAADFVVAADDARFGFTEVRIGLVPAVISPFVLRAIGRRAAQAHFLTGAPFDAAEALRIGLVHRVVPANELDAAVDEIVGALGRAAPGALGSVKRLLNQVQGLGIGEARELTIRTLAERRASEEGQEGMRAFLEKRDAAWVTR